MTDKYIGLEQYKRSIDSIKDYIDKSIPHIEDLVLFTLSANKVLEIYNNTDKIMEFDKPNNIDLNNEIIMTYNNEDIIGNIEEDGNGKYISCNSGDIGIRFYLGIDINHNTNENKMVISIPKLNTDVTSDLILKQVKTKYLNNKYLKKDVAIQNSITIGSRLKGREIGIFSFSNGYLNEASGIYSHAEGDNTTSSAYTSHAEGTSTTASGDYSHAEGNGTTSSGDYSHAEGSWSTASGNYSHAEGYNTKASSNYSHAEGRGTKASSENQHVQGKYNIEDTENKYTHIVGNGTNDGTRSNAHTLDWNGNAWFAGKLTQEGTPTEDKDLTTKKYVDDNTPIKSLPVNSTTKTGAIVDVNNITVSGCYALPKRLDGTHWTNLLMRAMINDGSNKGKSVMLSGYQNHVFYVNIESKKIYCDNLRIVYNIGTTEDTTYIRTEPYYLPTTNTKEFTPTSDYNPATKKYVDDAKASIVVPTKTSELTNDSKFLTTIPDNYITDEKLSAKGYLTEHQSLDGYAKTEYVDSKTTLEETIFEGVASDTINDYWTHCSLADGEGCWVIDKEVIIGENIENPYYIEINGTIYSPENSTYDATNKAWIYDYTMDNGKKLFICANYENQNKMVVPWDGMGSYDKLKIFTKTELGKKIEEQQQHSMNKFATKEKPVFIGNISMGRKEGSTIGDYSVATGYNTTASGKASYGEGNITKALGNNSHAEGNSTNASGDDSHAEGCMTSASGDNSHAEGYKTVASGSISHAEGNTTTSSGNYSHAEGTETTASGYTSHAEGHGTTAHGENSHAEGQGTTAHGVNQHVEGKYNIEDTKGKYVHIVGNGDSYTKSNAHTLDWNGNAWFAGKLTQEGTPTDDKDLITKKYFNDNKPTVPTKTSELTNDSNFLTEHQSLANYATIEYVDSKLTTNYVSKEELTESTKPADTPTVKTTLNDILGGDYIE